MQTVPDGPLAPVAPARDRFLRVRGAREHNLANVSVDIPRDALVVFTGVSGSGKSSLAFGTIYAEAQRRYLESVAPYARRLFDQVGVPDVDAIEGLPPAIALEQQRGTPNVRSSVGSVTTISNLLRMLYARAGRAPKGQPTLYAEDFSPNTTQGACPRCHGLGFVYDVTEKTLVPDDALTIRERAVAAWPPAWHGQNLRDILVSLGYDVDTPWRDLSRDARDFILFTDEQPTVPVYAGFTPAETRAALRRKTTPSYNGTFIGARKYVLQTFATTESASMKKRAGRFMIGGVCALCEGKRLKPEALAVTFAGRDIAALSASTLDDLAARLAPFAVEPTTGERLRGARSEAARIVASRICEEIVARLEGLRALGLGYLTLERTTPTLSPGELQRVRIATQLRSSLFGVLYVLDEPTAGLHPVDGEALFEALVALRDAGNSVFLVEHDLELARRADWLVDVGPDAGQNGGRVLYSGPPQGLRAIAASRTAGALFAPTQVHAAPRRRAGPRWITLRDVHVNNVRVPEVRFPRDALTAVTGVSGSGKSSLVTRALVELVGRALGQGATSVVEAGEADPRALAPVMGAVAAGIDGITRLVHVDQRAIGRTPRSNLATYTGLFDDVRQRFAATTAARRKGFGVGRFSFNVASGRCPTCEGDGVVSVELLFMPPVHAPCPTCHGARFDEATLSVKLRGKSISDVLGMTVADARVFFADDEKIRRALDVLHDIGVGYLRLGQPATELSGGEAQRIKLASELVRARRGSTLYVLDEPTTGLHAVDVDRLASQLESLVDAGNTVVLVEHEMRVVARCDHVIDLGPGAGAAGGRVVASGTPEDVARSDASRTAPYLARALGEERRSR